MDGQRGEHGVEAVRFVGERFEVWDDVALDVECFVEWEVCVAMKEGMGGIDAGEFRDSFCEWWGGTGGRDGVWVRGCKGAGDVAAVCA